jgi:hypothetical protein
MNTKGRRHLEVRLARDDLSGPQVVPIEVTDELIEKIVDRGLEVFITVKAVNLMAKIVESWLVRR